VLPARSARPYPAAKWSRSRSTTATDRPGMFPVRIIVATVVAVPAGGVPVEIVANGSGVAVCMMCPCPAGSARPVMVNYYEVVV